MGGSAHKKRVLFFGNVRNTSHLLIKVYVTAYFPSVSYVFQKKAMCIETHLCDYVHWKNKLLSTSLQMEDADHGAACSLLQHFL